MNSYYLVFNWVNCTSKVELASALEGFLIHLMLGTCCMPHNIALSLVFTGHRFSAHIAEECMRIVLNRLNKWPSFWPAGLKLWFVDSSISKLFPKTTNLSSPSLCRQLKFCRTVVFIATWFHIANVVTRSTAQPLQLYSCTRTYVRPITRAQRPPMPPCAHSEPGMHTHTVMVWRMQWARS